MRFLRDTSQSFMRSNVQYRRSGACRRLVGALRNPGGGSFRPFTGRDGITSELGRAQTLSREIRSNSSDAAQFWLSPGVWLTTGNPMTGRQPSGSEKPPAPPRMGETEMCLTLSLGERARVRVFFHPLSPRERARVRVFFHPLSPRERARGEGFLPSPLPEGEGQGEGFLPSPLPEGEGQGEGFLPSPLPEGEGQGEGFLPSPLPEGEGQGEGFLLPPLPEGEGWGEGSITVQRRSAHISIPL